MKTSYIETSTNELICRSVLYIKDEFSIHRSTEVSFDEKSKEQRVKSTGQRAKSHCAMSGFGKLYI